MQYFGMKLKNLRENKGLNQAQLAAQLGVVTATVSAYEKNRAYPSVEILIKICTIFHVSADYMLGLSNELAQTNSFLTDGQIKAVRNLIKELENDNIAQSEE